MANSTRDGARAASAFGNATFADHDALHIVQQAISAMGEDQVERIVIFDVGTIDGSVPSTCASGTAVADVCNVYTPADFSRPRTDFGCKSGQPLDRFWCPFAITGQDGREVRQSGPPDYVGVYIEARHDFITGFFGSGLTFTDEVVMRLEPQDL